MSAFKIKIDDRVVRKFFKGMSNRSTNLLPLMKVFAGRIELQVKLNFRLQSATADILSESQPDNIRKPWLPLSSLTLAIRAKATGKGTGSKRLQASGVLFGSIGKSNVITSRSLEFGTPVLYAAMQHFGGTIVPKRAKKLAIPYPGVRGRPRQFENTFFAKKSIFQKQDDGTIKPLFMLKDSVTIPASPFMTLPEKTVTELMVTATNYLMVGGFSKK